MKNFGFTLMSKALKENRLGFTLMSKALKENRLGFTLVELIVVFSIMGLIMAIAIPSFNVFNQGQTLKNAAAELKSSLSAGQTRAISGVKTCSDQNAALVGYEAQFFLDATSYTVVERCSIAPDGNMQTYGLPSLGNVRLAQGGSITFKPLNQGLCNVLKSPKSFDFGLFFTGRAV